VSKAARIVVAVPGGSYDVLVGRGLLSEAGVLVRQRTSARRVSLVTDDRVAPLFARRVLDALSAEGLEPVPIVVNAGEKSKNWQEAGRLVETFSGAGLGRDSAVIALGGGVIGDLAGFAAAVYLRGVPVVHLPTTLLAQVDSSIGGKTGVDLPRGKNLAGAFWQPALVIVDPDCLGTLAGNEWSSGLAEVAKSALLDSEDSVAALERDAVALGARERDAVDRAVLMSVGLKARVVSGDEREDADRECLNLGHTFGHALERELGYGVLAHGVAVAEGLRFAARLAEREAGVAGEWTSRQGRLLDALGLPPLAPRCVAANMLEAMRADKKVRDGRVRFVFSTGPGMWKTHVPDETVLADELARTCQG